MQEANLTSKQWKELELLCSKLQKLVPNWERTGIETIDELKAMIDIIKIQKYRITSGIIPNNVYCFMDGDQWCCVFGDFINLQESPAGFGKTTGEALKSLKIKRKIK